MPGLTRCNFKHQVREKHRPHLWGVRLQIMLGREPPHSVDGPLCWRGLTPARAGDRSTHPQRRPHLPASVDRSYRPPSKRSLYPLSVTCSEHGGRRPTANP